jgi:hypothetical protein
MRLTLAFVCLATPLWADTPLTADQFEAYVMGKTLTFGGRGQDPYGAEQYMPGRRVIWTFLDEDCSEGEWYPQGPSICFIYDFDLTAQCWQFFDEPGGLRAEFMNDPGTSVLYQARESTEPLACPGPKVGV